MRRLLPVLAVLAGCAAIPAPAAAIVGGVPASEEYPWMVSLQDNNGHFCGGSLVRPDWVLTAAHCPEGSNPDELKVRLGTHKLSSGDGEEIAVKQVIMHERYADDRNGGHDIALLQLERPSSKATMRIVSQSESALWGPGQPARVIGWGSSVFLVGPGSNDLMQVDVPMVSDEECDFSYNVASPFAYDRETMVCAGEDTGLRDSCQGDSGGPLVVKDAAGQWTQVGTVSFGLGCGFPIYYGVYGRIGGKTLNDWLNAKLPPAAAAPAPGGSGGQSPPASSGTAPGTGSGSQGTDGTPPSGTNRDAVRITFTRTLGSARKATRAKVIRLRVRSTGRVQGLKVTVLRRGHTVAAGRIASVSGRAVVKLRVRRGVKPGAVLVRLRGKDAEGRKVERSGAGRLTR